MFHVWLRQNLLLVHQALLSSPQSERNSVNACVQPKPLLILRPQAASEAPKRVVTLAAFRGVHRVRKC